MSLYIKTKLKQFKLWWRYLIIILGLFIAPQFALAYSYSENFEGFGIGDDIVEESNVWWYASHQLPTQSGCSFIDNMSAYGNGLALRVRDSDPEGSCGGLTGYFDNENSSFNTLQLNFRQADLTTALRVIGDASSTEYAQGVLFQIELSPSGTGADAKLYDYNKSTSTDIIGNLSLDTWYTLYVEYDRENDLVRAKIGFDSWSNWLPTNAPVENLAWNWLALGYNSSTQHAWVDNVSIGASASGDNISFVNPLDNEILTIDQFYWQYQFSIATSTYWDTYDFLNVDLGLFHSVGGVIDSTTTFSVLREEMSSYVPLTTYDDEIRDISSFPDKKGAYTAIIMLKGVYADGSTDTLGYDTINFGIATTTVAVNTAWCEDTCNDIASSSDFFGNFTYGFKCGGATLLCYAIMPPAYMYDNLFEAWSIATSSFPMSVGYDLVNPIVQAGDLDAASSTVYNLAPVRWSGHLVASTSLLTNKTLENGMGSYLYSMYWSWSGYLLWSLFYIYLLARFISMTGGFHANWSMTREEGEEHLTRLPNGAFKVVKSPDKRRWWRSGWFNKRN